MSQNVANKQARAIACILQSRTLIEAADCAKVNRKTLQRWMQDDAFRAALKAAQDESVSQAVRRLASLTNDATATLADALDSRADLSNVKAASEIFKAYKLLKDTHDIDARLTRLEELTDARDTNKTH